MENIKIIVERFFSETKNNKKEEFILPCKLGRCDITFFGSRDLFIEKIEENTADLALKSLVFETENFQIQKNCPFENIKHFSNFSEKITFIGE